MHFAPVAMTPQHPQWLQAIARQRELYQRSGDMRSPFERDYTRLLHSTAYRRLKHKTQVFFASANDHVCTRMEHVQLVASVSHSLCKRLGLNRELAQAIALGHDLGHAPFGHHGERVLADLAWEALGRRFWHEGNSLRFVDGLETLPDPVGCERNLDLTYAVRDGIVAHCGEVTEARLSPRSEAVELSQLEEASVVPPFTWEGCVVKVADTIAYLGRDIEDANRLGLLGASERVWLVRLLRRYGHRWGRPNNGVFMHELMLNLVATSSPEEGIGFAPRHHGMLVELKQFSRDHIYNHDRLVPYQQYATLVIRSIYQQLEQAVQEAPTLAGINQRLRPYPLLAHHFCKWLATYAAIQPRPRRLQNRIIYALHAAEDCRQAIIDFISGMTDQFAIRVFQELTSLQMDASP